MVRTVGRVVSLLRTILRVVAVGVGNLKPRDFVVENFITGVFTVVNLKAGGLVVGACEGLLVGNLNPGLRVVVVLVVVVRLVVGLCVVVVVVVVVEVVVVGGLVNGLCVVVGVVVVGGLVDGLRVVVVVVVVGGLVVTRGEVNALAAELLLVV